MQQLLALPRGPAGQQQHQQAHTQHSQNELHSQMQQEAREHLKQQQLQNLQIPSQKIQQQLTQQQSLWGGMQSIVPTPSFTSAPLPGTHSAMDAGMKVANHSTVGMAASDSRLSAEIPTGKPSEKSSACIVS
jgi:hypothetical protein